MAVALTLLVAGCSGSSGGSSGSNSSAPGSSGEKDKLVLGMTADINGWQPNDQPAYQAWGIDAVYDRLVKCQRDGSITAAAAATWELSKDNKSFTAHLRPGLKFTDGTPVDASAVEASFKLLGKTAEDRYGGITYASPDANTITMTWAEPQPLMNTRVCSPYLASAKYLASGDLKTAPVGSGPYTLDKAGTTAGSVYSFVKNEEFYDAKSYPYKRLELRVITSETASLNALKTGQINGTVITASSYDEATRSNLKVLKELGGQTQFLLSDHLGKKIPALGNVDVRRAINMVLDKQQIVDKLYDGHAEPIYQTFHKGDQAYVNTPDPYPYDVAKAKALMQQSGFQAGFTLPLATMEGQAWTVMLPYVTQQLALLNIKVEQKALTGPNAITELLSGDFPAPLWTVGSPSSLEDITIQVLSSGFWNVMHQPDAKVDALWQQILTGDEQQKVAAQQEIGKYVLDQAWFAPILSPASFYAYDSKKVAVPAATDPSHIHPLLIDFK
jgi:peptide/nickel transport system substrate-binding protein